MVYDVTMLEAFYAAYKGKVEHVRAILKRPLTLAEKILYAHLLKSGLALPTFCKSSTVWSWLVSG